MPVAPEVNCASFGSVADLRIVPTEVCQRVPQYIAAAAAAAAAAATTTGAGDGVAGSEILLHPNRSGRIAHRLIEVSRYPVVSKDVQSQLCSALLPGFNLRERHGLSSVSLAPMLLVYAHVPDPERSRFTSRLRTDPERANGGPVVVENPEEELTVARCSVGKQGFGLFTGNAPGGIWPFA